LFTLPYYALHHFLEARGEDAATPMPLFQGRVAFPFPKEGEVYTRGESAATPTLDLQTLLQLSAFHMLRCHIMRYNFLHAMTNVLVFPYSISFSFASLLASFSFASFLLADCSFCFYLYFCKFPVLSFFCNDICSNKHLFSLCTACICRLNFGVPSCPLTLFLGLPPQKFRQMRQKVG